MPPRRILALSADAAVGTRLARALETAGGEVQLRDALGAPPDDVALVVIHLDGALANALPDLLKQIAGGDTRIIAVVPQASLPAIVALMQTSDRMAGMIVTKDFNDRQLAGMALRVIADDLFGLEKLVTPGAEIQRTTVGSYHEKMRCIEQVSAYAERMKVRRKYREAIQQCVDEMLMNALYDAPVDASGKPLFSERTSRTDIMLPDDQKAIVEFACDGSQFLVAVRDAFGSLERSTVLRYLHKCLHDEQQIDRKVGGAGLGLYLMTSSSTTVYFNVVPRVATEAICAFDLQAPKLALTRFGIFTGRPALPAARRAQRGALGNAIVIALAVAIALTIALIAFVVLRG